MAGAVTFVIVLATIDIPYSGLCTEPLGIAFMQTITFILVIASLVQMVEIILKKVSQPLYQALGIFLPLITTNCAVLGLPSWLFKKITIFSRESFSERQLHWVLDLALIIMAGIREQLELVNIPKGMNGVPISLVIAGILALAFMGFQVL